MTTILLRIHENGTATLYENDTTIASVGKKSGMEEMISGFESLMKRHNLPYRLSCDYTEMVKNLPEPTEKMVHPYCGSCGHNYFNAPQIPLSEAQERAKKIKCHYCIEDDRISNEERDYVEGDY